MIVCDDVEQVEVTSDISFDLVEQKKVAIDMISYHSPNPNGERYNKIFRYVEDFEKNQFVVDCFESSKEC